MRIDRRGASPAVGPQPASLGGWLCAGNAGGIDPRFDRNQVRNAEQHLSGDALCVQRRLCGNASQIDPSAISRASSTYAFTASCGVRASHLSLWAAGGGGRRDNSAALLGAMNALLLISFGLTEHHKPRRSEMLVEGFAITGLRRSAGSLPAPWAWA
jgi:hypothetical protein